MQTCFSFQDEHHLDLLQHAIERTTSLQGIYVMDALDHIL